MSLLVLVFFILKQLTRPNLFSFEGTFIVPHLGNQVTIYRAEIADFYSESSLVDHHHSRFKVSYIILLDEI